MYHTNFIYIFLSKCLNKKWRKSQKQLESSISILRFLRNIFSEMLTPWFKEEKQSKIATESTAVKNSV